VGDVNVPCETMILFNARSILRKWPMICNEINIYNASIVAVTETWLFDEVSQYYSYHDYHHFYRNRQNGGGGGVALYFNKTWSVSEASLPVGPPASCNVLPVMDMKSGHC
jgi:hypothetical protein